MNKCLLFAFLSCMVFWDFLNFFAEYILYVEYLSHNKNKNEIILFLEGC